MRSSVSRDVQNFRCRIIRLSHQMLRAKIARYLKIFFALVSMKVYHRGTFCFEHRYTVEDGKSDFYDSESTFLIGSMTSNTDLGNSLSLNQITWQGRLLAFSPALSRFNLSEIAKIKLVQPDLCT